ncbi:site-specific integrase [Methanobrevibacter filiformis]|uniref:Phage integrase family protein n=1 Tax=Methanobrevibacter filiformis TaxID=55758 RepID=A0A166F469_9EURY|nr:tyrosine-type recombinase/integrase [Methanobrevibacter filiformis]KZX17294.1 hypothetical protein MBFIL_02550 [Methanobrevibacter filiformis]
MIMEEDLKILKNIQKSRNWAYLTLKGSSGAVKSYTEFNDKSLRELLKEAEKEEIEGIRWKERKLKERLIKYRSYLYDNYLIKTAIVNLNRIKTIYRHFEIELHELPHISDKNANHATPIYYKDLPDHNLIKLSCDISGPLMTAIILFMSSSGSAKTETLNLTIKDFIKATQRYHHIENLPNENPKTILNKIINDLIPEKNIIPEFSIIRQKTNNPYKTYCSNEATKAIMNYLLTRTDNFNLNSKLFKTNTVYFHERFKEINEKLNIEKIDGKNRFRSHMLRKFHASNLSRSKKKDGRRQPGMKKEYVDALQGRGKLGTDKSYFFDDYEDLRDNYIEYLDRITIYSEDFDFKTKEFQELEEQMEKNLFEKDKVISNIAGENIKLKETIASAEELERRFDDEIKGIKEFQDTLLKEIRGK